MDRDSISDSVVIGDEVKKSLSAAGFSVKSAAERAGLSYRTVLRYVKGERDMPVSVLLALMNAANADLVALAERLQPRVIASSLPPRVSTVNGIESSASAFDSAALDPADSAKAILEFDSEMRELGVEHVTLHALGAVSASELRGSAAVVAEIVTELRKQQEIPPFGG